MLNVLFVIFIILGIVPALILFLYLTYDMIKGYLILPYLWYFKTKDKEWLQTAILNTVITLWIVGVIGFFITLIMILSR